MPHTKPQSRKDGGSHGGAVIVVRDALDAFAKSGCAEIHQETERKPCEAQIGKQLLAMHGRQALDRFELDDKAAFDEKISPEPFVRVEAFKTDRDRLLPLHREASTLETVIQKRLID